MDVFHSVIKVLTQDALLSIDTFWGGSCNAGKKHRLENGTSEQVDGWDTGAEIYLSWWVGSWSHKPMD